MPKLEYLGEGSDNEFLSRYEACDERHDRYFVQFLKKEQHRPGIKTVIKKLGKPIILDESNLKNDKNWRSDHEKPNLLLRRLKSKKIAEQLRQLGGVYTTFFYGDRQDGFGYVYMIWPGKTRSEINNLLESLKKARDNHETVKEIVWSMKTLIESFGVAKAINIIGNIQHKLVAMTPDSLAAIEPTPIGPSGWILGETDLDDIADAVLK